MTVSWVLTKMDQKYLYKIIHGKGGHGKDCMSPMESTAPLRERDGGDSPVSSRIIES